MRRPATLGASPHALRAAASLTDNIHPSRPSSNPAHFLCSAGGPPGADDVKAIEAASGAIPVKVARVIGGACMIFGHDLKLAVPQHQRAAARR